MPPSGPTTSTTDPDVGIACAAREVGADSCRTTATEAMRQQRAHGTGGGRAGHLGEPRPGGTACPPRGRGPATSRAPCRRVRPSTGSRSARPPRARSGRRRPRSAGRPPARRDRPWATPGRRSTSGAGAAESLRTSTSSCKASRSARDTTHSAKTHRAVGEVDPLPRDQPPYGRCVAALWTVERHGSPPRHRSGPRGRPARSLEGAAQPAEQVGARSARCRRGAPRRAARRARAAAAPARRRAWSAC